MTGIHSVGIVGLGLIGGSLARDFARCGMRVRAWDRDPATLRRALDECVIESALDPLLQDLAGLDVVILAVPLTSALDILERSADRLVRVPVTTDVCSTKHSMAQAAVRLGLGGRFIGGHPLAGDHRSGWAASRPDLFRAATVYLCPSPGTPAALIARVDEMWSGVGARPEIIDAAAHDRLLAWTSHLPQAAATALARALAGAGVTGDRLGPGGRDMTRLAHSSPDVWTPVAVDNAAALCAALESLEGELAALRAALVRHDSAAVRRFFDLTGEPTH
jgi:prephenate dehydrogenase